jgi:hypothetical protein
MAKFDLNALKERLKPNSTNAQRQNYNAERFNFWNMNNDEEAIVRFLPNKDENDPWWFHEYKYHEVWVDGKKRNLNCLSNYGEKCPLCDKAQEYYANNNVPMGRKLYRKISWLGQVIVIKDPLPIDPEVGKNANGEYRTVSISKQVYDALIGSIKDDLDDSEHLPTDYEYGTNFIIKKFSKKVTLDNGKSSEQADYSRSRFAKKQTELDEDMVELAKEKLVVLSTLMPSKPEVSYLKQQLDLSLGKATSYSNDDDDYTPPSKPSKAKLFDDDDDDYTPPVKKASISVSDFDEDDEDDEDGAALFAKIQSKRPSV